MTKALKKQKGCLDGQCKMKCQQNLHFHALCLQYSTSHHPKTTKEVTSDVV